MKKICYLMGVALSFSAMLNAQTVYDATTFTNNSLNGTARFIGMGGAMGALGGDISTISTNPAGIGLYRSNDLMLTFGTTENVSKATSGNSSLNSDRTHGTFGNFGFVYSVRVGNSKSPVQFVNFGFNYRRSQPLYGNLTTQQTLSNTSQIEQMNYMAQEMNYNKVYPSEGTGQGGFAFDNANVGWLPLSGYRNGLIGRTASASGGYDYYANMPVDANHNYTVANDFHSRERGGIDAFDMNMATNIRDRIYLGMTLSLYDIDYSKYTSYAEDFGSNYTYNVQSWNKYTGSGWDLKLGAIIRPIEESSFRVGLAVHTPTFYNLTRTTSTRMEANFMHSQYPDGTYVDSQEDMLDYGADPDVDQDYKLHTPWLFNGSLGYVIGQNLALGAEYEYRDYSSSKLYDNDGNDLVYENQDMNNMLKGVSTYRFGAEYKLIPQFSLRLGFNHSNAAYSNNAFKYVPYNSIITDTDYSNIKQTNNFSFGFGYRGHNFYADFAYLYTHFNSDFYPFADTSLDSSGNYVALNSNLSHVKNDIHNFKITLGYRF